MIYPQRMFPFGLRDSESKKLLDLLQSAATPHTWKVIPWASLMKEVVAILPNLKRSPESIQKDLESLTRIRFVGDLPEAGLPSGPLTKQDGERILEFYFAQLRSEAGLYLDLRPEHWGPGQSTTAFRAPRVWVKWPREFREAVLGLYEGHYLGQDQTLANAASRLGMIPDQATVDSQDFLELKAILQAHFGDQQEVRFSLAQFRESFEAWFEYLARHDRKLPAQFAMLGAALIGLYLTLERIGAPLDARAAYLRSR